MIASHFKRIVPAMPMLAVLACGALPDAPVDRVEGVDPSLAETSRTMTREESPTTGTPRGCTIEGHVYAPGESFLDPRSCNTCVCGDDGLAICTLMYCPVCTVDGHRFDAGASFVGADLCNSCFCSETGVVGCTRMACVCRDGQPHNRHYLVRFPREMPEGLDRATLERLRLCPAGTDLFLDRTGIGCEQESCCQATYDCTPPRDCAIPQDRCPFSQLTF